MEKQVKKVSEIKLNQLSRAELDKRHMNALLGGSCICIGCGCAAAQSAGMESTNDLTETGKDW